MITVSSTLLIAGLLAGERFPLGPLGAEAEVEVGARAAVVRQVYPGCPAAIAGMQVGDVIVAAGGVTFEAHSADVERGGDGPQRALGEALDAHLARTFGAQDEAPPSFHLRVERDGEGLELALDLPLRAPLSGPATRDGRAALRAAAAAQLLRTQSPNGSWNSPVGLTGDRVLTAWALVALIGHGDPAQRESLDRAADWLRGPDDKAWVPDDFRSKGPDNLGNWALTYSAMALAEHHLAGGDGADLAPLRRCLQALTARMDEEGRFGHDVTVGYGGKGFNVINCLYQLALAMGAAAGVPMDESGWELSMSQLRRSVSDNGGVRYWTLGGTGTGDATLRTGALALALLVSGRETELAQRLATYLDEHRARAREAHAVGSLGMIVNAPALWIADPEAYERFIEEWRWYLTLTRGADDRLHYIGGKRNNGGDGYLGKDRIAAVIALQLLTCGDGHLRMQRGPSAESSEQEK